MVGDEIPLLARILHVADAFEAMTAARPYRMIPLTTEQALADLDRLTELEELTHDPAYLAVARSTLERMACSTAAATSRPSARRTTRTSRARP